MADSTVRARPDAPGPGPAEGGAIEALEEKDRRLAECVILEILRHAVDPTERRPGVSRRSITYYFWLAHLYYAKSNPGYLTGWPLVRTAAGMEIQCAWALLRELVEDGLVKTEHAESGPFPITLYVPTRKEFVPALSPRAVEAIRQAIHTKDHLCGCWNWSWGWPGPIPRAWSAAAEGGEIDIYLDLIPEEEYEQRRHEMKGLKEALEDLFS